jgi:hypothetical protein
LADVFFEPIAALLPLADFGTLDELAIELFAVWKPAC